MHKNRFGFARCAASRSHLLMLSKTTKTSGSPPPTETRQAHAHGAERVPATCLRGCRETPSSSVDSPGPSVDVTGPLAAANVACVRSSRRSAILRAAAFSIRRTSRRISIQAAFSVHQRSFLVIGGNGCSSRHAAIQASFSARPFHSPLRPGTVVWLRRGRRSVGDIVGLNFRGGWS